MAIKYLDNFLNTCKKVGEPLLLSFSITDRCNLNCLHCRQKGYTYRDLSLEEIKEIIDKVTDETLIRSICFTGGEPLIRKDFFRIVDYSIKRGINDIGIVTNGILLRENLKQIKDRQIATKVSLDGADEKTNDAIRGKGTFNEIVSSIMNAIDREVPIAVSTVITRINANDIEKMVPLLNFLGIYRWDVIRCIPMGSAKNNFGICPNANIHHNALRRLFHRWKEMGEFELQLDDPVANLLFDDCNGFSCPPCKGLGYIISISTNGDVIPTFTFNFVLGNALKESFGEIYNKEKTQALWIFEDNLPDVCKECKVRDQCLGGCRGYAYADSQRIYSKDPFCPLE